MNRPYIDSSIAALMLRRAQLSPERRAVVLPHPEGPRSAKNEPSGMVKEKSIFINSNEVNFIITDFKNEINVVYSGAVPNLFAEGKGVVAEGFLKDKNYFTATKILAKHDENYMPPEVKEAIGDK